jgi:threonine aldolase
LTRVQPFRSDNTAGVCPEVLEAIAAANRGLAAAYGNDDLSAALNAAMSNVFERRCWCFPVGTGTAANALALSALSTAATFIVCHTEAHILRNEDAAVERFTPGVRLEPLPGVDRRIAVGSLDAFARAADRIPGRWSALSLTQLTEAGTVYGLQDTALLAEIAHGYGARLHMDGARFANAVVSLRASPADVSWRNGVDILSFGATKNGTMNADAVLVFDAALARRVESCLKRAGQLYSKMRFMAAQLLAILENDLWLRNAEHANAMAQLLCQQLSALSDVDLVFPVQGNHVFVRLGARQTEMLKKAGMGLWQSGIDDMGRPVYRLVTSFATQPSDIEQLTVLLKDPATLTVSGFGQISAGRLS